MKQSEYEKRLLKRIEILEETVNQLLVYSMLLLTSLTALEKKVKKLKEPVRATLTGANLRRIIKTRNPKSFKSAMVKLYRVAQRNKNKSKEK